MKGAEVSQRQLAHARLVHVRLEADRPGIAVLLLRAGEQLTLHKFRKVDTLHKLADGLRARWIQLPAINRCEQFLNEQGNALARPILPAVGDRQFLADHLRL